MSVNTLLSQLNETLAMDMNHGFVIVEKKDPKKKGYKTINYTEVNKLLNIYAKDKIQWKGRETNIFRVWLEWSGRRDCNAIVMKPKNDHADDEVNLWAGYGVEPKESGEWYLFLEFLRDVICAGDMNSLKYLISWMADLVQNPEEKKGTAIVLVGGQGIGKSFFAEWFGQLFGQHFMTISSSRHLVGHFNAHLADKLVVFFDEAEGIKNQTAQAFLKEAITGPTRVVEPKGKDPFIVENCTRFIIGSNRMNGVIRASEDERRYCVLEPTDAHKNDTEYFGKIANQLKNGGLERMMYDLKNFEISIDLRKVPQTAALFRQKLHSLSQSDKWWLSTLYDDKLDDEFNLWGEKIPSKHLAQSYMAYAGIDSQRAAEMAISKTMKKLCPNHSRIKLPKTSDPESKVWFYSIPSQRSCRSDVEKYLGHEVFKSYSDPGTPSLDKAEMVKAIARAAQPRQLVQLQGEIQNG